MRDFDEDNITAPVVERFQATPKLFEQGGIEGLTSFDMGGSAGFMSAAQEDNLKAWVAASLPRSTRQVGAWIEQEFGLVYESRSGLIALLHHLGLAYHKPNVIPRKLDEAKQKALMLALIHVFLDNARYHHAKLVRDGFPGPTAGSGCISFQPIART